MTKLTWKRFVYPAVAALTLIAAGLTAVRAHARDYDVGSIHITQPWARATPKAASTGAAYLTVANSGTAVDRLSCVASDVSATGQIHSMSMDDGVMKMRPVEGGLEIPPGETITLKPSGLHLMLVDLKHALEPGKTLEATLRFEKAGTVKVDFPIAAIGASAPGAAAAPGGGTMMMNRGGMMQMNKQ